MLLDLILNSGMFASTLTAIWTVSPATGFAGGGYDATRKIMALVTLIFMPFNEF